MANLQRYLPLAPSQLLNRILDRPELVAAVRELPATTLSRLIDRVGLEDSGELIALASTEQLEAMFDEDLWQADASGFEERFDPQRFALWLQVIGEVGEEFLVRRLCELPLDLLTLAVNRLVLVIDMDALLSHLAGARDEAGQIERALENAMAEEWEEFRLIARDVDAWEDIWNALLLLDREQYDRLRAILERCCAMSTEYINGQGSLYEVLTSDEMLESDSLAERDDRRATHGYVSLGDALGFLKLAGESASPRLERDAITAAYFRALETAQGARVTTDQRRLTASGDGADVDGLMQLIAANDPDARGDGLRMLTGSATKRARLAGADKAAAPAGARPEPPNAARSAAAGASKSPRPTHAEHSRRTQKGKAAPRSDRSGNANPTAAAKPRGKRQPDAAVRRAHESQRGSAIRHDPFPQPSASAMKSPLAEALAALSTANPAAHTARMEELGYLANVLIAGCKHAGRKLRPVEALEAAIATCNLGLELWKHSERTRTIDSDAQLLRQLGCDQLFRVAWPALQQDLVQAAAHTLVQRFARLDAGRAREAQKLIQDGSAFLLRSLCKAVELEFDEVTFNALLALAEALPWQTRAVAEVDAADAQPWIASSADFERARRRLAELARAM